MLHPDKLKVGKMVKRIGGKSINNDRWLREHFEEIIDRYAGGFVIIGNGKILYTNKDGTPRELGKRVRKEHPGVLPLFFRVPFPHELICAFLITL
jgi:hypothetical protein